MSKCVVRMEMPECCDECPMEYDGFMCGAIHKRFYPKKDGCYLDPLIDPSKERLPDCPILCQLPKGHGRLVSEKDVRWAIDDIVIEISERIGRVPMTKNETMECVNQLPTIVPAERSET